MDECIHSLKPTTALVKKIPGICHSEMMYTSVTLIIAEKQISILSII